MRRSNKALTLTLALAIILGVSLTAGAGGPFPGAHDQPMGHRFLGLKTILELNLSDAQEKEILGIMNRYEGEMEAVLEKSRQMGRELRKALRAESFNEDEVRKAFRALSSAQEEHLVLGVRMKEEIKKVLTPEQQEMLKKKKKQMFRRFKGRLESWAGPQAD